MRVTKKTLKCKYPIRFYISAGVIAFALLWPTFGSYNMESVSSIDIYFYVIVTSIFVFLGLDGQPKVIWIVLEDQKIKTKCRHYDNYRRVELVEIRKGEILSIDLLSKRCIEIKTRRDKLKLDPRFLVNPSKVNRETEYLSPEDVLVLLKSWWRPIDKLKKKKSIKRIS